MKREAICIAENVIGRKVENGGNGNGFQKELSYTLQTTPPPAVAVFPICMRNATRTTEKSKMHREGIGIGDENSPSPTLTGMFVPAMAICVDMGGGKSSAHTTKEISPTLDCAHYGTPAVAVCWDNFNGKVNKEISASIRSNLIPVTAYSKQKG